MKGKAIFSANFYSKYWDHFLEHFKLRSTLSFSYKSMIFLFLLKQGLCLLNRDCLTLFTTGDVSIFCAVDDTSKKNAICQPYQSASDKGYIGKYL